MRILITRLSAIGDVILTMPMACALKRQNRANEITWLAESVPAKLLHDHPCVDNVVVVRKGWLKSPATILDLRRRLRERQFDVVLDPQSLLKSSTAGWLSGAALRIGFGGSRGREMTPYLNHIAVPPTKTHLVDCQMELLRPLGIYSPFVEFQIPQPQRVVDRVDEWLGQQPKLMGGPFYVLNTGAGWGSKRWPTDRYSQLAIELFDETHIPSVVVWAGDKEKELAETIVEQSGHCSVMAPQTSLLELAELFRRATLFVGSDTGPLHLAAAVGLPCVGLHGPTEPAKSGAYGSQHISVQAYLQTGPSKERRGNNNAAMQAISVGDVSAACHQILSHQSSRMAA